VALESIDAASQARFSSLLQYFQRGDFSTFCSVCELAYGRQIASEPFFCANLLFAAQVCGICEVSTATGLTKWWVAHRGDIEVRSSKRKQIGMTQSWVEAHRHSAVPLVADSATKPLVLGILAPDESEPQLGIFSKAFVSLVPPFKDIEKQLCSEVSFSDSLVGNAQAYEPETGSWVPTAIEAFRGPQLIRARKEYSGIAYYVQYADLGIRFRIAQPEWAFVVAYFLLPWRLSDVIRIEGDSVRMSRAVRIPSLMCRLLFAGANILKVGSVVQFEGVDPATIAGLRTYFSQVGDRG
jgi:hypothetical protein